LFQHLDDPEGHEVALTFRDDVLRRARQIRRRKASLSASIVLVVVMGFAAGALAWVNKRDGDIERVHLGDGVLAPAAPAEPVDIVLVGTDRVDANTDIDILSPGRADAIMLVRFDPGSKSLRVLSFPRDLLDPRTGQRFDDALVTDPTSLVDSVHLILPVPIHHYVELDFAGFAALVDELGGVRMALSAPINDALTGLVLPAGCSTLDGLTALQFVRARHLVVDGVEDPRGDIGRTARQQAFIAAALARLGDAATDPLAFDRYARILAKHAVLDDSLDLEHLVALARQVHGVDPASVAALTFPASMSTVNGRAMLIATPADAGAAREFLVSGSTDQTTSQTPLAPGLTIAPC
jgi:LCP family protein required for cell wall assembly